MQQLFNTESNNKMNLIVSIVLVLINLIILTVSLMIYDDYGLWYLIPLSLISTLTIIYYLSIIKRDIKVFNRD